MRFSTIIRALCRPLDLCGRIEDLSKTRKQRRPAAATRLAVASLLLATVAGQAQPIFISEPQSQSVSLGVEIILYAEAYGPGAPSSAWWPETPLS